MGSQKNGSVLIIAHRGSSGTAPENTLAAFRKAIDEGADMIELDIRMTKDAELVVLHDRTVRRTTNGNGRIQRLTLSDLRPLDAGSWFSRKFSGELIPTLDEVIESLPPSIQLNIEVKTDGEKRSLTFFAEALMRVLRRHRFTHRALVSSFNHAFLRRLRAIDPEVRIGVLYLRVRDFQKKPSSLARRVGAESFICSIAQLSRGIAEDCYLHDVVLGCYGVNTRRSLEKAVNRGASFIITDIPLEMRATYNKLVN